MTVRRHKRAKTTKREHYETIHYAKQTVMMSIFLDPTMKQFSFMKHVLLPNDKVTNSIMVRRHWPEEQVCPVHLRIITSNLCIETRDTEGQEQRDTAA
jgi:hypothetical protein